MVFLLLCYGSFPYLSNHYSNGTRKSGILGEQTLLWYIWTGILFAFSIISHVAIFVILGISIPFKNYCKFFREPAFVYSREKYTVCPTCGNDVSATQTEVYSPSDYVVKSYITRYDASGNLIHVPIFGPKAGAQSIGTYYHMQCSYCIALKLAPIMTSITMAIFIAMIVVYSQAVTTNSANQETAASALILVSVVFVVVLGTTAQVIKTGSKEEHYQ